MLVTACCIVVSAAPIALDNGAIRVELDPQLFSVSFVGIPGGENFVNPLPVTSEAREGMSWVDPGGLFTDILPYTAKDAASRRGPAQVVERREDYVSLLGPPSERTGMRLKKEVQLVGREPKARFRVSALRVTGDAAGAGLRNTVRVPKGVTLRIMRDDGDIRPLAGTKAIAPAVVKSRKFWLIPVPPTTRMNGIVLGAFVPRLVMANDSGTWTRTLVDMPADGAATPNGCTFLCILDDETSTYGAALQGATSDTPEGGLLVLEEEWMIERRGG